MELGASALSGCNAEHNAECKFEMHRSFSAKTPSEKAVFHGAKVI